MNVTRFRFARRWEMRPHGIFSLGMGVLALILLAGNGRGQDEFQSGLQPAAAGKPPVKMPKSFDVYTFNGKNAERFHCLVCENDIHPTVMLFLKEPAAGKEGPLESLFAKLDELVEKYQSLEKYPDLQGFAAYAVFVSPAAQTALDKVETDPAKLVKEATDRRALYARMREWAGKTKKVTVGCVVPESVAAYKLNPDASLTGLFYDSLDVRGNYSFRDLTEANVDALIAGVEQKMAAKIAAIEGRNKKKK